MLWRELSHLHSATLELAFEVEEVGVALVDLQRGYELPVRDRWCVLLSIAGGSSDPHERRHLPALL